MTPSPRAEVVDLKEIFHEKRGL